MNISYILVDNIHKYCTLMICNNTIKTHIYKKKAFLTFLHAHTNLIGYLELKIYPT